MKMLLAALVVIAWLGRASDTSAVQKTAAPRYLQVRREIALDGAGGSGGGAGAGVACVVLDAAVYAHAGLGLRDVRLFSGETEIPYVLTLSETAPGRDTAAVLNARVSGNKVSFDLAMPARAYSGVKLMLNGHDFVASAKVTGVTREGAREGAGLGTYLVFDLTRQRLGRSIVMNLLESTFPFLHVELTVHRVPGEPVFLVDAGMVAGAEVPPSREAQTLYTVVATTDAVTQRGQETVARFVVPARVPVERVEFALREGDATNFSRAVTVRAKSDIAGAAEETLAGMISRVHVREGGQEVREENLQVAATLGANAEAAAKVDVAIENADDRPLALKQVTVAMRERKVCFDLPAGPLAMFYGDPKLSPAVYDYATTFHEEHARVGRLGAEMVNPAYVAREERRAPLTERHPEILWLALLGVVGVLGVFALRQRGRG